MMILEEGGLSAGGVKSSPPLGAATSPTGPQWNSTDGPRKARVPRGQPERISLCR